MIIKIAIKDLNIGKYEKSYLRIFYSGEMKGCTELYTKGTTACMKYRGNNIWNSVDIPLRAGDPDYLFHRVITVYYSEDKINKIKIDDKDKYLEIYDVIELEGNEDVIDYLEKI